MPYSFDSSHLPETEDELIDLVMAARKDGIKEGRQQGAREIINRVDDWVKAKYFSRDVVRGTQYAEDILDLANRLVNQLIHGDLGKIPDYEERQVPKRQKNREG